MMLSIISISIDFVVVAAAAAAFATCDTSSGSAHMVAVKVVRWLRCLW